MLPQNLSSTSTSSSHSKATEAKGGNNPFVGEGPVKNVIQDPSSNMDKSDLQKLKEATKAQEHGDSIIATFKDPAKYQPYMESLMRSLAKRESVLGRYNHLTALTYVSIGNAYKQLQEPRAVAMFRTHYRIETILYGKTNGHIAGALKEILNSRGLSPAELEDIREDVLISAKYELQGDIFRRSGERKNAVQSYQKAARVEEVSFGRDNADLAYIWRKIACLAAITKPVDSTMDFDEADRMGNRWMRQAKDHLSAGICALIRKGDHLYSTLLYSQALGEYSKASRDLTHEPSPKKTKSISTKKRSKKRNEEEDDVSNELEELLASGEKKSIKVSKTGKNKDPPSSFSGRPASREIPSHSISSQSLDPVRSFAGESFILEEGNKIDEGEKQARKIKKDSCRQRSVERQKKAIRRKPASSSTVHPSKSLKQQGKQEKQRKPKSDSYLSKIGKVAKKTTKMAKRQLKRGANGIREMSASFHGDYSVDGGQKNIEEDAVAYNQMPSPPPTPFLTTPQKEARSMEALEKLKRQSKRKSKAVSTRAKKEPLGSFLVQANSSEGSDQTQAVDNRSIADQSIVSTDDEIRQRFLQTSSQISDRIEWSNGPEKKKKLKGKKKHRRFGSDEGEILLVDLARDVQEMSSLLQRQTLRLKNTIEDFPVQVPDKHLRKKPSSDDLTRKESRELSEEIQRLIQECEATIQLAFRQMDNPKNQKKKHSAALQEYRKTFTLEKAFLDELKHQLATLLPSSDSSMLGDPFGEDSIELEASFLQIASASFGLLNSSNETEPIKDESMLSIVFEDVSSPC